MHLIKQERSCRKVSKVVKKVGGFVLAILIVFSIAACNNSPKSSESSVNSEVKGPSGTVMLYSSLKENQLSAIKVGFTAKYPNIKMDYYAAGTGKCMTKIATEQQSGKIAADMIWVGDPSNYVSFKEQGILEPYKSPEAENIDSKFKDPDNMFVGARLIVMGFTYNTSVPKNHVPETWEDLLKPEFKDQIVLSDPTESGTTLYAISGLVNNSAYGWDYFKKLKENGAELESGTEATHNKVGAGAYKVCLGVDYVTNTLIKQGSTIGFAYPKKDLIAVSSPIAIIKGAKNMENAKLLYDYILSEDGQKNLAENQSTPIRKGINVKGSLTIDEIASRAMEVNSETLAKEKDDILNKFDSIFKK
ncbi:MAG TPA: ABC transporter substrate-binding protein [Clostridiaceae bacterium]|nr:ABC transporter substrate-binding protein [Clostridiaceae bacterium]